jgi:DNA-binding SARP family transcriptional activator
MPSLNVRLFGQLSIRCGDEAVENLLPGKASELFCYLLTHSRLRHGREFLASVLWGDCTTERSKQYLRKTLWQLQRVLASCGTAEPILQVYAQHISVNPESDIWVDVIDFERSGLDVQSSSWCANGSHVEALVTAANLYRGDLLEGWYQDWCLFDRERYQNLYLLMLNGLVASAQANHEYAKGIHYATRILQCDRANETAHQHLMRLRCLSGDRAAAVRQYEKCAAVLKEELSVQPSERTRQLYRQICQDQAPPATNGTQSNGCEPEEALLMLRGVLSRFEEVRSALASLEREVDGGLQRVRQALQSAIFKG